MPKPGGLRGPLAPQYLADQLTLFQPGEGRLSPPITTGPTPNFFTFRHHCLGNKKLKLFYRCDNSGLWIFPQRESSHQKEIIIIALFHNVKSRISEKGKPQFDTALIQCIKRESKKIKCRSRSQWDQNLYELAYDFFLQFQIFNRFLFHFLFHPRFKLYIFCVWNSRSI